MRNFGDVVKECFDRFEPASTIVSTEQEGPAKAQLCRLAGYEIEKQDPNAGYIRKILGENVMGLSTDGILDKSDGSWADMATSHEISQGRWQIVPQWLPKTATGGDPTTVWVDPTLTYAMAPGPMVLKETPEPPDPGPDPVPPTDLGEVKLLILALAKQQATDTAAILANSDENTEKIQQQIHDVIEDAEESMQKVLPVLLSLLRAADDDNSGGVTVPIPTDNITSVITSLGNIFAGMTQRVREKSDIRSENRWRQ